MQNFAWHMYGELKAVHSRWLMKFASSQAEGGITQRFKGKTSNLELKYVYSYIYQPDKTWFSWEHGVGYLVSFVIHQVEVLRLCCASIHTAEQGLFLHVNTSILTSRLHAPYLHHLLKHGGTCNKRISEISQVASSQRILYRSGLCWRDCSQPMVSGCGGCVRRK